MIFINYFVFVDGASPSFDLYKSKCCILKYLNYKKSFKKSKSTQAVVFHLLYIIDSAKINVGKLFYS